MKASTLGLILLSVTLSALAQVSFKAGMAGAPAPSDSAVRSGLGVVMTLLRPGVIFGLALYGVGTLIWLRVLAETDLSQAYPFVGLGFVLTAILGVVVFGETMTVLRIVGVALVILGICAIARS